MVLSANQLEAIRQFYHGRFAYVLEATSASAKITVPTERAKYFFTDGPRFIGEHFQLIKQCRAAAEKYQGRPPAFPWHVLNMDATETDGEADGFEMDATQAYIRAAALLKIFPRRLLARLRKTDKQYRLRIMGAIAARRQVEEYDHEGNLTARRDIFSRRGVAAWKAICARVSLDLAGVAARDTGFLAFWVDNYYTTNRAAAPLLRENYKVKIKPCRFRWKSDELQTRFWITDCATGKVKPFIFPRRK
jgi:hypothetical protein